MKLGNVTITGFMAIGFAALGLTSRGLVLIQGENRDDASATSNGSGKSTLPDALSWCLYGVTARGESGDDIINNNHKSASVVIDLVDDDECVYRVSRYRKDRKHKNHVTLEKIPPSGTKASLTLSSDKETQLRIDQVIGCDVDVFNAAIYQGQERIPDMPNMTDKQIKGLIEQAAGISVLEDCYKIALFRKNEKARLVDRYAADVGNSIAATERAEADLSAIREQVKLWDNDQELKVAAAAKLEAAALIDKQAADAKLAAADKKVPAINANVAKHQAILEEKNSCDHVLRKMRDTQREQETTVKLCQSEIDRIDRELKAQEQKLSQVASRIGTACGECAKPITKADLKSVILAIKSVIEKKDQSKANKEDELACQLEDCAAATTRADDYEVAMPDYTETSSRLAKCNIVLAKIETLRAEARGLGAAYDTSVNNFSTVNLVTNPHKATVARVEDTLIMAGASVVESTRLRDEAVIECDVAVEAMEVYSPAGVRAHILDHVTPFLNARTAHYLSALSDGNLSAEWSTVSFTKKGDMREKFSIKVSNITGGKKFGLLSGGEKRKVRLSCAMALQDVVSGRATKPIELFMADEIDDALDPAGLERLMGILEEKARERGTVLVISHNSLSDWIRDTAVVTKEGGEASITGALNV